MPRATVFVSLALLTGCTLGETPPPPAPDVPLPTTSPEEVVIKVPGMTCESCVEKVTQALAAIPWVNRDSIQTDRKARQAKFTVTDPKLFDFEQVKDQVAAAGYAGATLLTPPGSAR